MSDHFGILGIKGLNIFLKNFHEIFFLFFTILTFKLTSVSKHRYICTAISLITKP